MDLKEVTIEPMVVFNRIGLGTIRVDLSIISVLPVSISAT